MSKKWAQMLEDLSKRIASFNPKGKKITSAVFNLESAAEASKALDKKTHELIALAVAVTTRCDGCISMHAAAAKKHGATEEEVIAALGTAITLNAGASYIYSTKVLEAFNEAQ